MGKKRKNSFIRSILDKFRGQKPLQDVNAGEDVDSDQNTFPTLDYEHMPKPSAENELAQELRAAFDLYSKVRRQ